MVSIETKEDLEEFNVRVAIMFCRVYTGLYLECYFLCKDKLTSN